MNRIGIVGFGNFGKFLLQQLQQTYFGNGDMLNVFDNNQDKMITSLPDVVFRDSLELLITHSDIIILCVPMREMESVCRELEGNITSRHIIIDVCSSRTEASKLMLRHLGIAQLVGVHPLFGPQSWTGYPQKHTIALCNINALEATIQEIHAQLRRRDYNVVVCSTETHDKEMAATQALTHFIGRVLIKMGVQTTMLPTKTYQDLMAIVNIVEKNTKELYYDMQCLNPFAAEMRNCFLSGVIAEQNELEDDNRTIIL